MSAASAAAAAAANAAAAQKNRRNSSNTNNSTFQSIFNNYHHVTPQRRLPTQRSRYESIKQQDWDDFVQYLQKCEPQLLVHRCSGDHVVDYFRYLDQFGRTKVHHTTCPYFGQVHQSEQCECPLRLLFSSLDSIFRRLRVAFEESIGSRVTNPFAASVVRQYLREVSDSQATARGLL